MIIKHPDDKSSQLAELERLRALASGDVNWAISQFSTVVSCNIPSIVGVTNY